MVFVEGPVFERSHPADIPAVSRRYEKGRIGSLIERMPPAIEGHCDFAPDRGHPIAVALIQAEGNIDKSRYLGAGTGIHLFNVHSRHPRARDSAAAVQSVALQLVGISACLDANRLIAMLCVGKIWIAHSKHEKKEA